MTNDREMLRTMVFSCYDLQKLRIQMGLRLVANFRSQLKDEEKDEDEELGEEALKVVDELKASYRRLTDGIAKNRTLPTKKGFKGDDLISTYTQLVLVHEYLAIEANERAQFTHLAGVLEEIPIYTGFLRDVRGIGPAMAAVCIAYLDPHKAERPSDFWAYAGLDVAPDGKARSRRKEHLVERRYTDRNGEVKVRVGVTYNPWLKSRLLGAMGAVFLRTSGCPYREVYDQYKHRLMTDPLRHRVEVGEYKKAYAKWKRNETPELKAEIDAMWPPGKIDRAAIRYAVKMFLLDLWNKWRAVEGLPVYGSYHEQVLGHRHVA